MKDNLFDDFIREKMNNRVAAVPAGMWQNILSERKREKDKFFWWRSAAILFMVGLSVIWYTNHSSNQNQIQPKNSELNTTIPSNPYSVNGVESKENKPNSNQPLYNVQANANAVDTIIKDQNQLTASDKLLPVHQLQLAKVNDEHGKMALQYKAKDNNKIETEKPNLINGIQVSKTNNLLSDGELKVAAIHPLRPLINKNDIFIANEKNKRFNAYYEPAMIKMAPSVYSSVDCPSDGRRGKHGLFAEFYFSPDVAIKQMEYKRNASGATPKDSNTTRQFSFSTGFRLAKEIGQNMIIRTGLQYAQINERFDYRNENERTTSMVITIRTITNSNGTTSTVRDTSIVEQIGYRVKTSYNYYKTWDVPLIVGYEFLGEGWKANINAGPIFNLTSLQSGDFLDSSYRPASFSKKGPAMFKNKLGISLYGSISLIKDLSNVTSLFAEPYLRYSLSDRTTVSSPFTQRFHTAGVLLGIRFKLN